MNVIVSKTAYRTGFRPLLGLFMAGLFCLIMVSNMLFMHSHTTVNGTVVIHVHPYKLSSDGSGKKHKHTEQELYSLDYVHRFSYTGTDLVIVGDPLFFTVETGIISRPATEVPSLHRHATLLRGPPLALAAV
jgi:hypothetical protein